MAAIDCSQKARELEAKAKSETPPEKWDDYLEASYHYFAAGSRENYQSAARCFELYRIGTIGSARLSEVDEKALRKLRGILTNNVELSLKLRLLGLTPMSPIKKEELKTWHDNEATPAEIRRDMREHYLHIFLANVPIDAAEAFIRYLSFYPGGVLRARVCLEKK